MGAGATSGEAGDMDGSSVSANSTIVEFKKLPSSVEARAKFEEEGTLSKNSSVGLLSLRAMLDDPYAQNALGQYSASILDNEHFMCWTEIQEFKSITAAGLRYSTAMHLYHKYIKADAPANLGLLSDEEIEEYTTELDSFKVDHALLESDFYVRLQSRCLMKVYENVYMPFTKTSAYNDLTLRLKKKYNRVRIKDFDFYEKLGQGGFGLVVHCRKITTGKHYAMKIQRKKGLMDCFKHDTGRLMFEKDALASCQHPFIVNLDYSFQTNSLVMLCLGLSRAGDLQKALLNNPNNRLPEARVKYYVAEIVLAISYLHQLGLVYRDLKPGNILLDEDGHIRLVDLGGVSNVDGGNIVKKTEDGLVPLFSGPIGLPIPEGDEDPPRKEESNGGDDYEVRVKDNSYKNTESGDEQIMGANGEVSGSDDVVLATKNEHGEVIISEQDGPLNRRKKKKERSLTVMGTLGYMAPEMVVMLSQRKGEKTTYNEVVDWWSLGATLYKLLTGSRAFSDEQFSSYVGMATTMIEMVVKYMDSMEYVKLFSKIQYPPYISIAAQDLISKLLDVSPKSRLGAKPGGVEDIKKHPFFAGIDWNLLEQKHVLPPFVPVVNETTVEAMRFEDFMEKEGKNEWLTESVPNSDSLFNGWDFISPNMLRIEAGLSSTISAYDKKFKVKNSGSGDGDPAVSGSAADSGFSGFLKKIGRSMRGASKTELYASEQGSEHKIVVPNPKHSKVNIPLPKKLNTGAEAIQVQPLDAKQGDVAAVAAGASVPKQESNQEAADAKEMIGRVENGANEGSVKEDNAKEEEK